MGKVKFMSFKLSIFLIVITILAFACKKSENEVISIVVQNNEALLAGSIPENTHLNILDYINLSGIRNDSSAVYYGEASFVYLDGDFSGDLLISVISVGNMDNYSTAAYVEIRNNWEVCLIENDTTYAKLIEFGDAITEELNWQGINNQSYYLAIYNYRTQNNNTIIDSTGSWNNTIDGYLGIRKIQNTDTIYGWIKMDIYNHFILVADEYVVQNKN